MTVAYYLLAAVIHELGHFTLAKILGVPLISFRGRWAGALMTFDFSACGYLRECAVHLGGVFFGGVSALVAWILFGVDASSFILITAVISTLNLLPIERLDGGGAVKAIVSYIAGADTARKAIDLTGTITVIAFTLLAIWIEMRLGANISLIILAITLLCSLVSDG